MNEQEFTAMLEEFRDRIKYLFVSNTDQQLLDVMLIDVLREFFEEASDAGYDDGLHAGYFSAENFMIDNE